jgi:hypothetical protein
MTPHAIRVFDDVVADPHTYRAAALAQPCGEMTSGAVTFKGLAPIGASPLSAWLKAEYGLTPTFETFRLSPEGQDEPSFVHTDRDMGDWTCILYLNPDPPATDGTTFWKYRATGAIASSAETDDAQHAEWVNWRDTAQWEPWHTVQAVFNRAILFPAPYFHSRAIFANWGAGLDARLIQLCFGTGSLPCV